MLGRARALRPPDDAFRRPQTGGRPDHGCRRIRELRLAVNDIADETLGPDNLMPRLRIDGGLAFREITGGVAAGSWRWRPSAPAIRVRSSPRAVSRSSTARASSRSVTSRCRSSRRDESSAPSPGAPRAPRLPHRTQGRPRRRLLARQNFYNGNTYVELLSPI